MVMVMMMTRMAAVAADRRAVLVRVLPGDRRRRMASFVRMQHVVAVAVVAMLRGRSTRLHLAPLRAPLHRQWVVAAVADVADVVAAGSNLVLAAVAVVGVVGGGASAAW